MPCAQHEQCVQCQDVFMALSMNAWKCVQSCFLSWMKRMRGWTWGTACKWKHEELPVPQQWRGKRREKDTGPEQALPFCCSCIMLRPSWTTSAFFQQINKYNTTTRWQMWLQRVNTDRKQSMQDSWGATASPPPPKKKNTQHRSKTGYQ